MNTNLYTTNRRSFLQTAGLALATLALRPAAALAATTSARKPNFIFFITDDISADDLGPYGNTTVKTPNLDRLARSALVFDNAHLTISSCSPSRCSIITGRYPHNTGAPELHTRLPEDQHTFVQDLHAAGYHTILSGKNHMAPPSQLGFDESSDSKPAGSENWIDHLRNRPKDKPFFCWFASHDAHRDWQINDKAPTYDPADVPVPPMLFDGPRTREDLTGYYHEVSRTDHYTGLLLDELERQGIADNTYLIYTSDNGRPFPRCKTSLYHSGIRTPLIIAGPNVRPGRTDSLVSAIDLAPTILELAHLPKPETIQGVSFTLLLADHRATTREVAFAERNWHVVQLHERMVRTGHYLYIWNAWPNRRNTAAESAWFAYPAVAELWDAAEKGLLTPQQLQLTLPNQPPEMLFNTRQDPHQMHNLANDPAFAPILDHMRSLLDQWKQQTGDTIPENPTPNRNPLHGGQQFENWQRGQLPGHQTNAPKINHPGPITLEHSVPHSSPLMK